jgi:hypothetical protein
MSLELLCSPATPSNKRRHSRAHFSAGCTCWTLPLRSPWANQDVWLVEAYEYHALSFAKVPK